MGDGKPRRNTRQRQVVLEELRKLASHPTAVELYEIARRRLPKISLATVYRNLELLTRMGIARKLETRGGQARFDGDLDRHYHVRCVNCGRVDDVRGLPDNPVNGAVEEVSGYDVQGFRLEFFGVCPGCQGKFETETEDGGFNPQGYEVHERSGDV
ncbi:MAG: transcriptional repressor [bacterium]|nr:transcriptional repressor [bacterium]